MQPNSLESVHYNRVFLPTEFVSTVVNFEHKSKYHIYEFSNKART